MRAPDCYKCGMEKAPAEWLSELTPEEAQELQQVEEAAEAVRAVKSALRRRLKSRGIARLRRKREREAGQ